MKKADLTKGRFYWVKPLVMDNYKIWTVMEFRKLQNCISLAEGEDDEMTYEFEMIGCDRGFSAYWYEFQLGCEVILPDNYIN